MARQAMGVVRRGLEEVARQRDTNRCGLCGGLIPALPVHDRLCPPCAEDFKCARLWC